MIPLDMKTVIFVNIIINGVCLIFLIQLWLQLHTKYRGLTHFVLFSTLVLGGMALISLRGEIPELASVVLANGMMTGGFLILYFGVKDFAGKKKMPPLDYALIVYFVVYIFIHFYFNAIQDSLMVRLYNTAISLLLFSLVAAWLVFRGVSAEMVSIARGVGISLIAYASVHIVRMFGFGFRPVSGMDFMKSGAFDAYMVLLLEGLGALISFNLVLMTNKRLSTERKKAEEEISKANEELHSLAIRLQEVREETQISISHDLHDDLGSKLAVLKMEQIELEGIISKLHDCEEKDLIKELSKRSKDIIDSSIQSARRIMTNLRPSVLDDFGLVEALKWQMEEFNSHTGITSEFHTDFGRVDVENNCATAVFRILQEVLGNVARHSGASKVFANLGMEGGSMFLEVTDNGIGITPDQLSAKGSTGILGMRQRAKVFGGEISVSGEAGKGTTVVVKVPMKIKESA